MKTLEEIKMVENFEEIFEEIQSNLKLAWYDLFDGENFVLVEKAIAKKYFNNDTKAMKANSIYKNWVEEMYWEL